MENTRAGFRDAFATLGYAVCTNGSVEDGIEKIAIFVDQKDVPTHTARQLRDGTWTSKLGQGIDITHDELDGVGDPSSYELVGFFMSRAVVQPSSTP